MIKKAIVLLLLMLIQFAAGACADNNMNNNAEDIDQPPFACELDRELAELVLTYMDGRSVRFSLADNLFLLGLDYYGSTKKNLKKWRKTVQAV